MAGKQVKLEVSAESKQAIGEIGKLINALNSAQRDIDALGKQGADATKLLDKIASKGTAEMREFAAAAKASGMPVDELKAKLNEMNQTAIQGLQSSRTEMRANAQAQAITSQRAAEEAQAIAGAMQNANAKAKEFVGGLMEAGGAAAGLQRQLTLAFGNPKAAAAAADEVRHLRTETGIAQESLASAAVSFQKFGAYSDENMTRAAVVSKKTGAGIEEVANAIGKFQKFGDARSQLQLKKLLGIDDKDIAEAGGALQALDAKFGTTTDGMVSSATRVKGLMLELREEIGIQLVKSMGAVSQASLPFVQALHDMPDAMKGAIGQGALLYQGATQIGSTWLSTASQMKMAGLTIEGVFNSAMAAVGPLGLALVGLSAVVAAGTLAWQVEAEQIQKHITAMEKLNKVLRDHRDVRLAIASGKQVSLGDAQEIDRTQMALKKQLLEENAEAQKKLNLAVGAGASQDQINALVDEIRNRDQLILKINQQREATAKAIDTAAPDKPKTEGNDKKEAENAASAWDNYRKRVSSGFYETKEEQLRGLEEVTKKLQHHGKAWTQAELEKAGVAKDVARKILASYEDTHLQQIRLSREVGKETSSKTLKAGLDAIEIEDARHKMGHEAKIARYRNLLTIAGITADQRIDLEKKIAHEEGAASDEASKKRAENAKKAEEAAKKAEEAHQKRLHAEEDIASKMKALAGETTADKMREIDRQVDAYRKAGVDELQIAKFAKLAKADLERKDAEKKLDEHQKTVSAQDQSAKDVEDDLKSQLAQGQDVSAQLTASINTRYQHEMDALRQKAALHQDDAEMQAQIQAQLQHLENQRRRDVNDVTKARDDENKKLDETKKKLEDLQKQKSFKGGAQSVAEAFGDGSTFGFSLDTGLLGGGGGKSGPGAAGASGSTGAGTTAAGASAGPMPATASAGGAGTPPLVPGAPAAAAAAGAPGDKSSWKSQKESSTIGGDPAAALNKIIELLSLIADRLQGGGGKPAGGGSPAAAGGGDAASGLGMALSRDAFFSKGK